MDCKGERTGQVLTADGGDVGGRRVEQEQGRAGSAGL